MTITDYAQCGRCHTRLIYPVTPTGQWLPAVNFTPDPAGTVAVWPSARGLHGRCLNGDEGLAGPEQRFSLHQCQTAPLTGALLLWPSQARQRQPR